MASGFGIVELLCTVGIIFVGCWFYLKWCYSFWNRLGVPGPKPNLFLGNFNDITLLRLHFGEAFQRMFKDFPNEPMLGIYSGQRPVLLLRDPEFVRDVLIKDFSNFSERGNEVHEKIEPLGVHLFNLETKRWRSLRPKLSPVFTSGKMKQMFALISECADYFDKYLETQVEKGEPIDCREITAKFTTDVIGSCAFGLQMNAIGDEESEFRRMGKKVFQVDLKIRILSSLRMLAPRIYEFLGQSAISEDITHFFINTIKQTMGYREENNTQRGDFVDALINLKNHPEKTDFELTDNLFAAQAFVFFVAGFETSSSTISNALFELAQRQDVQDKLRQEILESLKANDGSPTYESVKDMKYLHMVFEETLRLRPPVVFHMRKALNDYTFKGTNVKIPKGQMVWIPIWDIHYDPRYYPNPEVFDPERFTEEMCKNRHPMTYLPFGDGPRNCIGARFGVYQTKLGLIKILAKYKVEVCEKTVIPFKPDPAAFLLVPLGGIHLKFSKI